MAVEHLGSVMATIHFRDDSEPVERERVFIAENGWVALSDDEEPPVMYPADTVDPLGGSYYVESLTDDLEAEAFEILDDVDRRGGMLDAVESGWVKRQIQDVAFERQQEIESGDRVVVGVNEFQVDEEPHVDVEEADEDDEARQRERLQAVKDDRDDDAVAATLAAVRDAAAGDDNVMPPIVDAVKAYATVGEISDVLRDEFGEYQPRL